MKHSLMRTTIAPFFAGLLIVSDVSVCSAGDLLQALFGGLLPAAAPAATSSVLAEAPVAHPRPSVRQRHAASRKSRLERSPKLAGRVVVDIMNDPTLRTGDAVMTADGLRVFVGTASSRHTSEDFVAVSDAPRSERQQRLALLEVAASESIRRR